MRTPPTVHPNRLSGLYRLLVILTTAMSVEIQRRFDTPSIPLHEHIYEGCITAIGARREVRAIAIYIAPSGLASC